MKYATDAPVWTAEQGTPEPPVFWTPEEYTERAPQVFITLARARHELRVPPGDTGQDELIRNHIRDATSQVADDIAVPILDTLVQAIREPGDLDALQVVDVFAIEARAIRIRGQGDPLGVFSQTVADGTWSQANPSNDLGAVGLIAIKPNDAWPDTVDGMFAINYTRGMQPMYPQADAIRSLVILKLRDLFLGVGYMKGTEENSAGGRLSARLRRFDTPEFLVVGLA